MTKVAVPLVPGLGQEMLPVTEPRCWICLQRLTAVTDGQGKASWTCTPCRTEIEALQAQVTRPRLVPAAVGEGRARWRVVGRERSTQLKADVIALARKQGPHPNLEVIAGEVGRTPERVRQILVEAGVWQVKPRRRL